MTYNVFSVTLNPTQSTYYYRLSSMVCRFIGLPVTVVSLGKRMNRSRCRFILFTCIITAQIRQFNGINKPDCTESLTCQDHDDCAKLPGTQLQSLHLSKKDLAANWTGVNCTSSSMTVRQPRWVGTQPRHLRVLQPTQPPRCFWFTAKWPLFS